MKTLLKTQLLQAIAFRKELLEEAHHESAFRLFNGFTEGDGTLSADVLARTLILQDYSSESQLHPDIGEIAEFLREQLPFLEAILVKKRSAAALELRNGQLLYGEKPSRFIVENGIRYAVDPLLNSDNSFYSDTRELRKWIFEHAAGKRVLNTFAYTGSLGVAAAKAGAAEVIQTDQSGSYLELAYRSASRNGFAFRKHDFLIGDFFRVTAKLRKARRLFDLVILDPPFFSHTAGGTIDNARNFIALVNKVRPLVADDGFLIVVNNALYLAGKDFLEQLKALESDGCVELEQILDVPPDAVGPVPDYSALPVADPAPFRASTKIAVLKIRKKAEIG